MENKLETIIELLTEIKILLKERLPASSYEKFKESMLDELRCQEMLEMIQKKKYIK